ncbi:MAG: hydroxyacid dehydrogenase [Candidatus Bathyarchaeia archaeon]
MENRAQVLVCDAIHEEGIEKLKRAGLKVDVEPTISGEDLKKVVSKYDALIVRSRTKVTREIIDAGWRLKVIGRAGVGVDNIDVKAAEERGILVLNTPEAPAEAVAELTMGLMISLARQIPRADQAMKEGKWLKGKLEGWQLKGKTLGIIGLGNVGERVARIAKALEMRLLITKRTPPDPALLKELGAEFVPLKELFQRSDIITIHVPLTSQTYHMIGPEEFQSVKEGAFLINTSRGAIVDEGALLAALKSGKLGGAALDVYETEPPTDLALVRLPNVVATPHIGAQTIEAQKTAAIMIAEKLINQLKLKAGNN